VVDKEILRKHKKNTKRRSWERKQYFEKRSKIDNFRVYLCGEMDQKQLLNNCCFRSVQKERSLK
jgi:hypothetical protein